MSDQDEPGSGMLVRGSQDDSSSVINAVHIGTGSVDYVAMTRDGRSGNWGSGDELEVRMRLG